MRDLIGATIRANIDRHNHERICTVYFENKEGYVIVAPDPSHPTPVGFERKECHTLKEIDALTLRMNRQDKEMFSRMVEQDRKVMIARHEQIRSKLKRRSLAPDCGPFEQAFIRVSLKHLDRRERELENFNVRGYFQQREFDSKNAKVDDYGTHPLDGSPNSTATRLSNLFADILTK